MVLIQELQRQLCPSTRLGFKQNLKQKQKTVQVLSSDAVKTPYLAANKTESNSKSKRMCRFRPVDAVNRPYFVHVPLRL